ncbi:MAG: type I restriction enzyme HsdR N-terminal domain-containing protein [Thermodesulfobacteriota bacterium]
MNDSGHHYIFGQLEDYLTGRRLTDTHDERYRQRLARLLVESCGYAPEEIAARIPLIVTAGNRKARITVDFAISLDFRVCMVIQYGPGSLVTRYRPALAISRMIASHQIPIVVVTNGEQADILDGRTGKVLGSGLDAIPGRETLRVLADRHGFEAISAGRLEKESRILYAFEVDDRCPCDDGVCREDVT